MSVDKEDVTLTLQDTEMNDAGTYKVEASNKLGSVNTECTVDVQGLYKLVLLLESWLLFMLMMYVNYYRQNIRWYFIWLNFAHSLVCLLCRYS